MRTVTKLRSLLLASLLLMEVAGCAQPTTPHAPVLLRLSGSTSMQPLLQELASAYMARYNYVTFNFSPVGSASGLEALRRESADLALVAREIDPQELTDIGTGQPASQATAIARDAVAVIVNEKTPIRKLSSYQLRNLFEGQTLGWEELGGSPGNVVVVSREDGSGTRVAFEALAMRSHRVTSTAIVMPGSEAMRDYVAQHEGAVGYVSLGWLGPGVAAVAIDNVEPNRQTIEAGTYPLTRPFFLVCNEDASPDVTAFVQFAASPAGQAIVRRVYGGAPR